MKLKEAMRSVRAYVEAFELVFDYDPIADIALRVQRRGVGIDKVTQVMVRALIKGGLTFRHPEFYLFFTSTANGRKSARDFLRRLKERRHNRDRSVSLRALFAQLKAIRAWGRQAPRNLSRINQPVPVANGDQDEMVPSSNSIEMARRLPSAELVLYEDAGHGGIFQYHEQFVPRALAFLET